MELNEIRTRLQEAQDEFNRDGRVSDGSVVNLLQDAVNLMEECEKLARLAKYRKLVADSLYTVLMEEKA